MPCVDVQGDEDYQQSRWVFFEEDRLRTAAPMMLAALRAFIEIDKLAADCHDWKWEHLNDALKLARAAVTEATAGQDGGRAC